MVEWLLRLFLILIMIIISQSMYNTLLYRQEKTVLKIAFVSVINLLLIFLLIPIWKYSAMLQKIPIAGKFIYVLDAPFRVFFRYLPRWALILWFVVPLALIWVIFLFRGGIVYIQIKNKYKQFMNRNKEKNEDEKTVEIKEKPSEKTKLIDQSKQTARIETHEEKIEKRRKDQRFLDESRYTVKKFNYKSSGHLKMVTKLSKNGLILGRTANGYIGIFTNLKGYKELKKLFSENSLDISKLEAKPSAVIFTKSKITSYPLREYISKLGEEEEA